MRHRRWLAAMACLLTLGSTGCIGAVDRGDFEQLVLARGGGLVTGLSDGALSALRQRLGAADFQANVILFTAPDSDQFRLVLLDQPAQVSRFLAGRTDLASREIVAHLRVRQPGNPRQLDDYTFVLGALSSPRPVRVSAFDNLDAESFAVSEVSGLSRMEEIVDTSVARSGLTDGRVRAILVSRFGRDIRIVTNVASARSEMAAEFDHTGAFLRIRQL